MKKYQIFIGDIKRCTKYERHVDFSSETYFGDQCIGIDSFGHIEQDDELYKKDAILIRIKDHGYVDLEKLSTILDYIEMYLENRRRGFTQGDIAITTYPCCEGDLFVDESSLKPYFLDNEPTADISVRALKRSTMTTK